MKSSFNSRFSSVLYFSIVKVPLNLDDEGLFNFRVVRFRYVSTFEFPLKLRCSYYVTQIKGVHHSNITAFFPGTPKKEIPVIATNTVTAGRKGDTQLYAKGISKHIEKCTRAGTCAGTCKPEAMPDVELGTNSTKH